MTRTIARVADVGSAVLWGLALVSAVVGLALGITALFSTTVLSAALLVELLSVGFYIASKAARLASFNTRVGGVPANDDGTYGRRA